MRQEIHNTKGYFRRFSCSFIVRDCRLSLLFLTGQFEQNFLKPHVSLAYNNSSSREDLGWRNPSTLGRKNDQSNWKNEAKKDREENKTEENKKEL